jgi:hypothetical protein
MTKSSPESVTATVTGFDSSRGVALVRLPTGETAQMHAGAFISGRPARLPSAGETVHVQVRTTSGRPIVIVGRPAASRNAP